MPEAYIREIFFSIQGEGPRVGEPQLFIRFCGCNLNCRYCDTDFDINKAQKYTLNSLIAKINSFGENLVISLTGGEPLVSAEFLSELLPVLKKSGHKIYLETNATLPDKLAEIIDYVDIVSADIKLSSASGQKIEPGILDNFFNIAKNKELFAKIVFDKNITPDEIDTAVKLAHKYSIEIILQPKMNDTKFSDGIEEIERIFYTFTEKYDKVRLIPQMHKFLNVR